ncbi:MAG: 2-oxo acid dehydrogenase subunit E2 [Candidatus Rariloculaceae bacterium]
MQLFVPDLGEFDDVEVIEILVGAGDNVSPEDPLIVLETDKATMEVPAERGGVIQELLVSVGDRVSTGDQILVLDADSVVEEAAEEESKPAPAAKVAKAEPAAPVKPAAAPAPARPAAPQRQPVNEAGFAAAHASPSVRKLARELGVDLSRISGTGHKGRVTADDLKSYVKQALSSAGGPALPEVPEVDFAAFGEVEVTPLTRIQKISGPRLHASWVNVPHVTQHDEADITDLEARRQELKQSAADQGIRLTPLAFILRACVIALAEFPRFASSLSHDNDSLVMKSYRHIGFAADTPNGLVVPVIRDADQMNLYEVAGALAELSERARSGKLGRDDMQGGVFTISSLGGIGGTAFSPIINAPEVAILGVSRSREQPVFSDGEWLPRLMLPLSLSYDHRVIDGAAAARFITHLSEVLGEVDSLAEGIE